MFRVCSGEIHCKAEEEGEVEKVIRKLELLESEIERWEPKIGSEIGGIEKGRGELVWGLRIWWMERLRESREIGPV